MKGFFARRAIALQERMTGESAEHMRDIHAGSPAVFWRLTLATALYNHQKALPRDISSVAAIAALRSEDCGPCVQIAVNMALRQGVSPAILRIAATGAITELVEDARLAMIFLMRWQPAIRARRIYVSASSSIGERQDLPNLPSSSQPSELTPRSSAQWAMLAPASA